MLSKVFSSQKKFNGLDKFNSNSIGRINLMRNVNTLTRNGLTLALMLLLLTAGMMLATPQDAHAQSISVSITEPTGTQTSKTFKVEVTLSHTASAGPSGNGEFTPSDITVTTTNTQGSGDATVLSVIGSSKKYDITIRPPGNAIGSVTLTIKANSITAFHSSLDWIHGPSSDETSQSISFDTTNLLMVDFTEPEGTQTGSTFTVPIDFSHTVTNFDATDDIDVATTRTSGTGDATVALSGSGSSYTATVTPPSNAAGSVTLTIKANMVGFKQNLNGPSSDETSNSISFDTVPITVGFTEPESSQSGTTFDVPITFNKSVTGFASSDITVTTTRTSGTGDATVALSGSGTSWTATVTSPTAAKGTITLEVAANAVTDSNSVTGPASKATSDAMSFDTTVATVDFTEPSDTQVTNTFDVPITFSKSVTGFAAADITITTTCTSGTGNATFTLNGSGTSWTATVTSPTAAKGTITLEVAADSVTDGTRTGPASKATSDAMSFDTTVPKVDFTEPTSTQVTTFDLPITFSKSVTGFAAADINLNTTRTSGTGDATFTLSGSGKDYKATITVPTNAKGTIRLEVAGGSVTDGTRTGPSQKTDSDAISFDTTPPTVDFTEPTDVQAKNFSVEITFSKSVTGFTSDDITINTTRTSGSGDATFTLSGSGKVYTATITVPTNAKGTVTLAVAKGAVTDGTRTGPSQKTDSDAMSFDTTPPTVSFTEPEGSQYGNTFTVPITISKSVAEFTASDITVTTTRTSGTGNATVALSGSGSSYTATVTSPTAAKGTITLAVAADSVTDGTRTGPASKATSSAISFDTTVATVDFTEPTVGQATNFDLPITFSKSVTGFATADITITTTRTSGTGDATFTLSGSGKDYTAAITVPTNAKGTVTLAVAADSVTDGTRTGPASKTTSDAISFDTAPPSVTFGEPVGIQYEDTFSVPIAFGKSVTGFAASDITITTTLTSGTGNATFTLLGSGAGYSVNVTPSTETKGTITLQVAKDAVADSQNRSGPVSATTSESISFDNTTPSATYTVPQGVQVTNFDVPIKFSKFILDFELNDLTLTTTRTSGTGDATFRIPGVGGIVGSSGTNFTAKITLPANAAGTVNLSMQADAVEDTGEHEGPSSATETGTISFDTRVPTVSFTEPEGTQVANTFDVPITISKSVTGFAASDITVTTTRTSGSGDATVTLSGSGTSYTATVTSPTTAKGTITLEVAKDAVTDGTRTGPASKATSDAISFDTTVATVSFTEPEGTQVANTFDVPITISKSVTGFVASDITVTTTRTSGSGDATVTLSGSGTSYTATVTSPTTAKGTITLAVAKDAVTDGTRTGPASKATSDAISFDTTVATVSFTEPAGTQVANTFDVPITISKSVTGFAASDITVTTTRTSGTGDATVSLSGSGTSYTATVTSPTAAKGTITLEVAKDAVTDGTRTGPASKATSDAISFDTTVATVSFSEPNGTQYGATFDVPITISKSVTGFVASDITVTTTRTSGSGDGTVSLSGSGTSYTATVTSPTTAKGTITLEVAKNAVTDGTRTGPANKATSSAIAFSTMNPTVTFTEPAGTQYGNTFDVPITFNKGVTGFASSDITVTSSTGTATVALSGSGTSYTATVTSPTTAKGTITLAVAADSVTDGTRTGPASKATSDAMSFDTTVATVSFSEPAGTQVANTFDVPITISKSVTGFAASDITVTTTRTSGSGDATVTLSGSGTSYTATVTSPTTAKGTITLAVAADSVTDGTRTGPANKATSDAISFDTTVATVKFLEPRGIRNGNTFTGATFDVGITFSKRIKEFTAGDIKLASSTGTATVSLKGSGKSYIATVTSPTAAKGTVTLEIAADSVTDGIRTAPASKATSSAIAFDTTRPTVSFTEPAGTQYGNTFDVGITFSKRVGKLFLGGSTRGITVTSSTGTATVSLSGSASLTTDYTATVTSPTNAKGTIVLEIAANAFTDGTSTVPATKVTSDAIAFDTTVPTLRFTEPQGVSNVDTFDIGITFSKDVTGFETSDITLTTTHTEGSGDATFTLSGSDSDYTAAIAVPSDAAGTITLAVAANAATDGNRTGPATVQSTNAISFSTTTTTPVISQPVVQDPTNNPPVNTDPNNNTDNNGTPTNDPLSPNTGDVDIDTNALTTGEVIFNEIYNGTSDKNDWIELKNFTKKSINLEEWEIGIVTGSGTTVREEKIVTLPKYDLLPDHILLIVNTAPTETDIAAGINILTGRWEGTKVESGTTPRYLTVKKLKLPVAEKFLLTFRKKRVTMEYPGMIVDIASNYWPNSAADDTFIWPLQALKPTGFAPVFYPDAAWRRIDKKKPGYTAAAWTASGYQEGRGYDKDAPKKTSLGTPGHPNEYPLATNLPSGPVAISEIMFATRRSGRPLPQWIEFYNISGKTVDLRGWQLNLEMRPEINTDENKTFTFTFEDVHVGPKQTLLIVTQKGSNSGHFPEHKVYDLSAQHTDMPGLSELLYQSQIVFSSAGFSLMLSDANGKVVDKVGTLDGDPKTMDNPTWQLPSGKTVEGHRSSLIRRYKDGEPLPGTEVSGWRPAEDLPLSFITYWGYRTDIGNPGYRQGGYLPVSLSHFNAVLTGTEVVLKWTTASELDNAGFNIYRSESLKGEFKQINAELIQGAGTTGERQQYEWKDTTAKPNVSYYYQIEDVSFSGVQEQLQTVRMRGHVSASGKELRTWASLKSNR